MSVFSDLDFARQDDPFSDEALGAFPMNQDHPDQIDSTYLAALIELGNVKGLPLVYACTKFVAAVFGKDLNDVITDAIDQLAPRGVSFGA